MSLTKSQAEALNAMVETGKVTYSDPVANYPEIMQEQRETIIAIVNDLSAVGLAELLEIMEEAGVGTFGSV